MPTSFEFQSSTTAPLVRAWDDSSIIHGFLGRQGGQSVGPYASMNMSEFVGDDPRNVAGNWSRLRAMLPAGIRFARVNQVHGGDIRIVTGGDAAERPRADGMVTNERGIVLAIFTADCVPILMRSEEDRAVGAVHAGWRGVLAGIAVNAVCAIERLGGRASRLRVALGPAIGMCCFEVDSSLATPFVEEIRLAANHVREGRPGKAYLDLRGIIHDQLVEAGVPPDAIENAVLCTRCHSDRFFSRRAAGGAVTGLQMSFIGLGPE